MSFLAVSDAWGAFDSDGREPPGAVVCRRTPGVRAFRVVASAAALAPSGPPACAIVVPARNEAGRLATCLEHCLVSIRASGEPARLVLLVNNSSDASVEVAMAWAARRAVTLDLVEVELADSLAHAGAARRLAFDIGREIVGDAGLLLTTDADSRPERGWVSANRRALAEGAALVCGRIGLEVEEAAALPSGFLAAWAIEDAYARASLELDSLLDPDPHDPWPAHGQTSGASLGITAAAYDAVGGSPVIPFGEDRALAARIRAHDLPIRFCDDARVVTSCRLEGRAPGGMAATIRARLMDADEHCDDRLEPALATMRRAGLRARFRRDWGERPVIDRLLRRLGLGADARAAICRHRCFGAAWASIETSAPMLRRVRLHRDQLDGELPLLRRLIASVGQHHGAKAAPCR